jgi:hypothetical protein
MGRMLPYVSLPPVHRVGAHNHRGSAHTRQAGRELFPPAIPFQKGEDPKGRDSTRRILLLLAVTIVAA